MAKKKRNKDNDSISINLGSLKENVRSVGSKTTTFFQNNKFNTSIVLAVFLVLALMFVAYDIRAQTQDLPMMDRQAEAFVANNLIDQIARQIEIEQPGLSQADRTRLARQQFEEQRRANEGQVEQQIQQVANELKNEFRTPEGDTYLIGIDPYYYWQLTQQYNETGIIYDEALDDGTFRDNFQLAPVGRDRSYQELHPVFVNWMHGLLGGLTGWGLYQVFFLMPALVAMLTVIPAFFIGRRFGGNVSGFLAGLVVAVHQGFVGRSVGGFSSTDSYNVLFPLLMIWFLIEAFRTKNLFLKYGLAAGTGLLIGVFSRVWSAWYFSFFVVLIALLGYLAYLVAKRFTGILPLGLERFFPERFDAKDNNLHVEHELSDWNKKKTWTGLFGPVLIVFTTLFSAGLFTTLLRDFDTFINAPLQAIGRVGIQDTVGASLWPNVLTTVAELNLVPINDMIQNIGGPLLFVAAYLGLILYVLPNDRRWTAANWSVFGFTIVSLFVAVSGLRLLLANLFGVIEAAVFTAFLILPVVFALIVNMFEKDNPHIPTTLLVSVFFVVSMFAYTQGNRFLLLVVPAFALALAMFLGQSIKIVLNVVSHWKEESPILEVHKAVGVIILLVLIGVPVIGVINNGVAAGENRMPQMNDAWYDTLTEISLGTDDDAIISSWWDFGHWFKEVADRRVTFDGATQNTPMAHWVGKALLTDDEEEFRGISRMLNCGSREGFTALYEEVSGQDRSEMSGVDFLNTKNLIDEAILLDRDEARELYSDAGASDIDRVLDLTHCEAPQSIWITSEDMVNKAGVWGYFGSWNFERGLAWSLRNEPLANAVIQLEEAGVESSRAQTTAGEARSLSERQSREWMSERPQYITREPVDCEVDGDELVCELGIVIQQTQQFDVIIAGAVVNLTDPSQTTFETQTRNRQNNLIMDRGVLNPAGVVINGERTDLGGQDFPFDISVVGENDSYQGVVASPALANSIFTDLFFYDALNTDGVNKLDDTTSSITGSRIVVWDIEW